MRLETRVQDTHCFNATLLETDCDDGVFSHTNLYALEMEGFLAPEGIMTHPCGKFYLPVNGYLGQDAHIADSVKAVRLMLGVDDNKENLIRLIPRFPSSWERCGIDEYPVLTPCGRGKLSYLICRTETSYRMQINLSAPSPLEVRIGPFDRRPSDTARINGENVPLNPYRSGDSWWCMISRINGSSFVIETDLPE